MFHVADCNWIFDLTFETQLHWHVENTWRKHAEGSHRTHQNECVLSPWTKGRSQIFQFVDIADKLQTWVTEFIWCRTTGGDTWTWLKFQKLSNHVCFLIMFMRAFRWDFMHVIFISRLLFSLNHWPRCKPWHWSIALLRLRNGVQTSTSLELCWKGWRTKGWDVFQLWHSPLGRLRLHHQINNMMS